MDDADAQEFLATVVVLTYNGERYLRDLRRDAVIEYR